MDLEMSDGSQAGEVGVIVSKGLESTQAEIEVASPNFRYGRTGSRSSASAAAQSPR